MERTGRDSRDRNSEADSNDVSVFSRSNDHTILRDIDEAMAQRAMEEELMEEQQNCDGS